MAKVRRGRAWGFLIVWIALTSFALTFPFHLQRTPKIMERGFDKVVHTSLFTVMGISAQAAAPWVSLLVTAPLAVGLELVQKRIPGRSYDITDMLANIVGMFLGVASFELSRRLVT
ncbi:MAG: VanZ family protein [candidate division WOR-3 bacterium]|nr:VanZ family protein [candidate division WOR-3 bacterium]